MTSIEPRINTDIENVISNHLTNIYFLWGRGKTTVANILHDRYGAYIYRTDEARDRLMLIATPQKQPYMCRDFEAEYGVSSFWELPSEVIADREVHFLEEMTPMIIDELVELSKQYSVIICEGDIDYKQIIELTNNIVYLQNCGTKFDWFNRPDHDNLDYIRNRTDIDKHQKQALIDQAYASVGNNESVLPDYVTAHSIKVIRWDDSITPEETADEVEGHFSFNDGARLCYSYVMGMDDSVLSLKDWGFDVKPDGENYTVIFPEKLSVEWENFVSSQLKLEYWNEYFIGNKVVFLFHLQDGVKRFEVEDYENDQVLKLCEKLCGCKFESIKSMLLENWFYKEKLGGKR